MSALKVSRFGLVFFGLLYLMALVVGWLSQLADERAFLVSLFAIVGLALSAVASLVTQLMQTIRGGAQHG